MNEFIAGFLYTFIAYGTPLILCSLGGMMTGLSGRFNLGMEGMMLFSAFFSLLFANQFGSLIAGLAMGVIITVAIGLMMAFINIRMGVDIYIAGMAVNVLGTGLTTFLIFVLTGSQGSIIYPQAPRLLKLTTPILGNIPYLNQVVSNHTWLDYLAIILVIVLAIVIHKTAFGRHIRAVGKSEWVASACGISVNKNIYASYVLCGILCGLAGASLSLNQGIFVGGFIGMTNGRGWLAMAVVILAQENPYIVLFSAWALGALSAIGDILQASKGFPARVVQMLPFIGALIAASIYSYRREKRNIRG
ncbi:MAG: ABC transporter permease [Lachnospiraceae bacterium]|jgi:simple sugar transport system permease protein|nr:ABC transporter permease [Lachnospiraceae bacterium]